MEPSLIQLLEAIVQEQSQPCTLNFSFNPYSIGPYGLEGSRWQASFVKNNIATIDYGATLAEAAQRLFDRLQYPEKYPILTDD